MAISIVIFVCSNCFVSTPTKSLADVLTQVKNCLVVFCFVLLKTISKKTSSFGDNGERLMIENLTVISGLGLKKITLKKYSLKI